MKQGMSVGVRPHMCGDSRCGNVNSHWWIVLSSLESGDRDCARTPPPNFPFYLESVETKVE
jgi:hypothetical protein